jgi:hypothetical protein
VVDGTTVLLIVLLSVGSGHAHTQSLQSWRRASAS